jgi:hypothetical protein
MMIIHGIPIMTMMTPAIIVVTAIRMISKGCTPEAVVVGRHRPAWTVRWIFGHATSLSAKSTFCCTVAVRKLKTR